MWFPATFHHCSLLKGTLEFVWRSGGCGSAVSIHHGFTTVGPFPVFPRLRAPTAAPTELSYTVADGTDSSHLFGAHLLHNKLEGENIVLQYWSGLWVDIYMCGGIQNKCFLLKTFSVAWKSQPRGNKNKFKCQLKVCFASPFFLLYCFPASLWLT